MLKNFSVSILTEQKSVYEGTAVSLVVPAELGLLGVWANHAPLAAHLVPGKITVKTSASAEPLVFHSSGNGFLEVLKNKATLLLDSVKN